MAIQYLENDASYRAGACNIGPAEIARRRRAGFVGVAAAVGLGAILVAIGAPDWLRVLVLPPLALGIISLDQARRGFCVAFAVAGLRNFDALGDHLGDVVAGDSEGLVFLWDGWGPFARADEQAFSVALSVLGTRVNADRGGPFAVLLRGDGPDVPGVESLD